MKPIATSQTRRSFTLARDDNGIPEIRGATWLDVLSGLGYMHALDRGAQMFFARSVASGRGAEQISDKPELLETDRFFRKIGLGRNLLDEARGLDDATFSQLTAYCEGVNDAVREQGRSWPLWAVNFPVEPWTQQAVLLLGQLLSFGGLAVSQLQNERLLVELIHAGVNDATLRKLFAPRLDHIDFELLRRIRISNQLTDQALELLTDLPRLAGSNAWAVSPGRSATGAPLLAADPHLEINRLPAIWYEAVLRWGPRGEHYLMGASLPGCPIFAVARTRNLAWGVTYLKGDTIDYFVEELRQGGDTGWQYRREDRWLNCELRTEGIRHKGAATELLPVWETPQGVIDTEPAAMDEGLHLAVAWTGHHPGQGKAMEAWLRVPQSADVDAAREAARGCCEPTLCWIFADRAGNIGSQACGRFPIRGAEETGLTPIPAWDPARHWQGWLDPRELPGETNPAAGFVASANEPLNPPGLPLLVTQLIPSYRKQRISERLREMPQASLKEMQDLQYDVISVQARELLRMLLPSCPTGPLKAALETWDCSYRPNSTTASLFHRFYVRLIIEILGGDTGVGWRRAVYLCTRVGYSMMIVNALDRILLDPSDPWWREKDIPGAIRRAALAVQAAGETPPWSEVNNFHFTDRFFSNRQVGRLLGFRSRRYPMPGNHATPFQGHVLQTATRETTFAPSYHFVTSLNVDEAWTNLPGGPSESRFSRWYNCDLPRWATGEYKRLGG